MKQNISILISLGGHQPYVPIGLNEESTTTSSTAISNSQNRAEMKQRARVLCSYDAKDSTELSLSANEVSFINFYLFFQFYEAH